MIDLEEVDAAPEADDVRDMEGVAWYFWRCLASSCEAAEPSPLSPKRMVLPAGVPALRAV